MKRFLFLVVFMGLISYPVTVKAITWSQLLDKMKGNYSSLENKARDMKFEGVMKMKDESGETMETRFTLYRKGNKFRQEVEISVPGMPGTMQQIVVYDGTKGYIFTPMGEKKELGKDEIDQYEPPVDWWSTLPAAATVKGTETVHGSPCYVVQAKEGDEISKLWIDKTKNIIRKVEYREGEHTSVIEFLNYKSLPEGGMVPQKLNFYGDGKLTATYEIKTIKYNVGLSDDLFNPANVKVKSNIQEMMQRMMQQHGGD